MASHQFLITSETQKTELASADNGTQSVDPKLNATFHLQITSDLEKREKY